MLYDYDDFYRSAKTVLFNNNYTLNTSYIWRAGNGSNRTSYMPTGQIEVLKDAGGNTITSKSLSYTYDALGNIETIVEGGTQRQKYYYDSLNQLIREDNLDLNQTIVYSYDLGGNIISTQVYPYQTGATVTGTPSATNTYTYGDSNWKDKLTAYNGSSITYDAIGNPTSYYNGYIFTWQKGRQLAGAVSGTNTVSYTYNNDGYRTSKTVNGTLVQYTLEGSQVRFERNGDVHLWYYYDAAGAPIAFSMENNPVLYFYRKNLQGDVTGVYKGSTGALLVSYVYDSWGKVTATDEAGTTESANVLTYNPYLYRGYRYDSETGLYYLNSRYYDPETGRFINADGYVSTEQGQLSANMFAYCENNPVNRSDSEGALGITLGLMAFGGLIGAITSAVTTIITQTIAHEEITLNSVLVSAGTGFVSGALAASPLKATGQIVAGSIIGGVSYLVETKLNHKNVEWDELAVSVIAGGAAGWIGKAGANENFLLTRTIENTNKTIAKETARSATKGGAIYAAKAISRAKAYAAETIIRKCVPAGLRFGLGVGASSAFHRVYSRKIKPLVFD